MDLSDPFARYDDDRLLQAERDMRAKAWNAPKSLPGTYNDAHARFGEAWIQLHQEVRRRGLKPSTEVPEFKPQERND